MKIMKFDFNKILILFLLISTIGFGLTWYFGDSGVYKDKVKELELENKKLEQDKKVADAKILLWKEKFNVADIKDKQLTKEVLKAKSDVKIANDKANKTKLDLDKVKGAIIDSRKEIEALKKNPPILSDEQLLESLIKKTN